MSRSLHLLGFFLLAAMAACGVLDREPAGEVPDSVLAADSTSVVDSGQVRDTATQDEDEAEGAPRVPAAEPDPVVRISTEMVQRADSQALAAGGDTTAAGLLARLDRLEAQNDSLRNTILGLVALQAGRESPQRDTAGTAEEILGRGAEQAQHWGPRIFASIVFLIAVAFLIRGLVWILDRLSERNAKRRLFFKRLVPITRILLWALAFPFAALVILGIDTQGILAAGAAIGVAVGFAAQDILKNIFGGIIVLFDQPFQVGDKVSIHGTYGEVVSIGLRSTRIVTPDDNLVTVPNAQVVGDQVANANAGELNCQVVTDLYLPGWVDEARAKRIAFEAASSSKYVYLNKPIVVLIKDEFDEVFLTHLKVKAYVLDPRYEFLFMSDVTERARAGFREAGLIGPLHGARTYADLDRVRGRDAAPPGASPGQGEPPTPDLGMAPKAPTERGE
ncbi:MAG: mechanosensitive ion channel [Gemmatimonadales bacterium]|nr:MAG: mechanosensitive ion channel [Gemmatimonadales bacterium]